MILGKMWERHWYLFKAFEEAHDFGFFFPKENCFWRPMPSRLFDASSCSQSYPTSTPLIWYVLGVLKSVLDVRNRKLVSYLEQTKPLFPSGWSFLFTHVLLLRAISWIWSSGCKPHTERIYASISQIIYTLRVECNPNLMDTCHFLYNCIKQPWQ